MTNERPSPRSRSGADRPQERRDAAPGAAADRALDDRLQGVDLATHGEFLTDHERDRDSKGVAGGYDDSIARRKGEDDRDRLGISRGD